MIPLLEAAAKKVGSEDPSEAEFALEASRCAVFGFAMSIGVYRRWTAGAPGAGADPVIVGLFARILEGAVRAAGQDRTFHGATLHLDAFIAGGAKVAPVAESETWQALLDLAAAWKGEVGMKVLRQAATGPSPALRLRAGGHLGTLGVPVPELPSHFREAFGGPRRTRVTRATIRTTRGAITVRLFPNQAPITVHNFVTLAGRGYFDGILFHRVVPAFVAQAGCPRGDGWGGPGHVIPCEVNDLTYRRGTLGMALAGKDTGGSQWFLCHEPQPRLDLRYTIFGEIQDGWDVLDALLPEDVILGVEVSEGR
jgi:cyclophilin family peptidyl-prolyl cis-trans isomerase